MSIGTLETGTSIGGIPLQTSPERFGELRETALGSAEALRRRMDEDGYLFIRGFFSREEVMVARRSILAQLEAEGALAEGTDLMDALIRPGTDSAFRPDLANGNPTVLAMLYQPKVMAFYGELFGEPARHYDYTWLRAMGPGKSTLPHYDIVYMGRGSKRVCTAWVPMGDVRPNDGALTILENSHRLEGLKATYGQMDVDVQCENKPGTRAIDDKGYVSFGALPDDPNDLARTTAARWLTASFEAGDLLTFSMFTLHASLDNTTDRIRISTDSRYQPAAEPADERWIGENPPGHGPNSQKNMIC